MPKVVSQEYLGNGKQRMVARFEDGTWREAVIPRGVNPPDANWEKITKSRDPAEFGEAMYHQGQGWAFVAYCAAMAPFFLIAYLLVIGRMQWQTVELISQICGLPVVLFFVIGMPIIVAIKKRNENPYQ